MSFDTIIIIIIIIIDVCRYLIGPFWTRVRSVAKSLPTQNNTNIERMHIFVQVHVGPNPRSPCSSGALDRAPTVTGTKTVHEMALNEQLFSSGDSSVTIERIHDYRHVCLENPGTDTGTFSRTCCIIPRRLLWTDLSLVH